jgi:hypothetical protein
LNTYGARQWLLANRASAEKPRRKPLEWKPEQPEAEQGPVLLRTLRRLAAISRAVGASGKPGRAVGGINLSSYRSAMKLRSGVAAADIWRGMSVILDLPEPAGRTTWPSRKSAPLDRAKRTNDAPHWSLKFEYDYLGLGNRTFVIPATAPLLAGDTFTSNNRNVQMVKVGINFLFNWGYNRY